MHLPMFKNPDLCGPCGGKCCKWRPGIAFPSDFGTDELTMIDRIREAMNSGRWTSEWAGRYRGEKFLGEVLVMRPAVKGLEGHTYDNSWFGECTFLTPSGCSLGEKRPMGCRGLEPIEGEKCKPRYGSKEEAAEAWEPFQYMLEEF